MNTQKYQKISYILTIMSLVLSFTNERMLQNIAKDIKNLRNLSQVKSDTNTNSSTKTTKKLYWEDAKDNQTMFNEWKTKHNKSYTTVNEESKRYKNFIKNYNKVNAHNNSSSNTSYKMALNKFSDMSDEEFSASHGYQTLDVSANETITLETSSSSIPDSWDWVEQGAVTPIKNQGSCGSCWSFSATGAMEGAYFIKSQSLVSLSEQQLVDCSSTIGNMGCNGGSMNASFMYANQYGMELETTYPYTGVTGTCSYNSSSVVSGLTVSKYVNVSSDNSDQLKAAVYQQPVSIAIDAMDIMNYSSGIYTGSCGTSLDHGVLVVGYGSENGVDYWKIKNSWGDNWGEDGYFRLQRTSGSTGSGMCGMLECPSYPVLA